ncbi:hypothetical protein ACA910_008256 [Epithemia clementina (nom. ined.)]
MVKAIHIRSDGAGASQQSVSQQHHHHQHHQRSQYETTGGTVASSSGSSEMDGHNPDASHPAMVGSSSHSQHLENSSQAYYNSRLHHHPPVRRHSSHQPTHHHSSASGHPAQYHYSSLRHNGQFHQHGSLPHAHQQPRRHYGPSPAMHHSRNTNHAQPVVVDPTNGPSAINHGSAQPLDHGHKENSMRPPSRQPAPPPHRPPFAHPGPPPQSHLHPQSHVHRPVFSHGHAPPHQLHPHLPPHPPRTQRRPMHETGSSASVDNHSSTSSTTPVRYQQSSSRPLPLQPSSNHPNIPSPNIAKSAEKVEKKIVDKKDEKEIKEPQPVPSEDTAKPSSFVETLASEEPTSAQKKPQTNSVTMMKSPVTLCFERMLGAAKYLAHNPTPEVVKEKYKKRKEAEHDDAESEVSGFQQPDDPPLAETKASTDVDEPRLQAKRTKTVRAGSRKPNVRDEGNPFVELERDEELLQKVILQMALISESKEAKRVVTEPVSSTIGEGFYWRDYPVLEEILFDNMKNYYNMSSQNRQSRHQQEFNNRLVASIREAALENGFDFDPSFNDKRLRDRIRCFYKTHLQNAKKRLATLQKHPNSPIHQSHLRIYIRCVKENMSVEDSEAMESGNIVAPTVVVRKRKQEDGAL